MENVSTHTFHLAHFLHYSLRELKHANGQNAIELYPNKFSDKECQSGIVTFNVKDANGDYIGYAQVDDLILPLSVALKKIYCLIIRWKKFLPFMIFMLERVASAILQLVNGIFN